MAAYCDAIAKPSIQLDSAALIEGDETALEDAHTLYAEIAALAPADMAAPWQVVQKELDSMLKAARGDIAVADVDYQGFNEAVVTIESDRRERCD
ncbi:MAG: hypothetical protein LBH68_02075 [Bifidobacteriaceae bacterium]|jgi:hypothetical protein|nr:hypothetical protein [Bifidobacteriaceae bacterium]